MSAVRVFRLEELIMSMCTRYTTLSPLVSSAFRGSSATELNIYVDIYSITRSLYSQKHGTIVSNYNEMIAGLINLCAHYRDYFRKYLNVNTKIFLVMSNNCCDINMKFIAGYNKDMFHSITQRQDVTNMISDNMELLNILCPYLPDIYFIRSQYEAGVLMSYLMDTQNPNHLPNMIVSKDPYLIQLVGMYPETCILRPIKYQGNDNSYIIGPIRDEQSIYNFWEKDARTRGIKLTMPLVHPCNYSMYLALSQCRERYIKRIMTSETAKKLINQLVGIEPIVVSTSSIYDLFGRKNYCSLEILNARHHAIDITYQKYIYLDTVESKMIRLQNLYDPNAVKDINNHYFYDNPLDLDRL